MIIVKTKGYANVLLVNSNRIYHLTTSQMHNSASSRHWKRRFVFLNVPHLHFGLMRWCEWQTVSSKAIMCVEAYLKNQIRSMIVTHRS